MKFWNREKQTEEISASGKSKMPVDRELMAEALESRILFSGAPLDDALPEVPSHEAPASNLATGQPNFGSVDGFGGESATSEGVSDLKETVILTNFNHLSEDELAQLAGTVINRGRDADLDANQVDILNAIEISMADISSLADPDHEFGEEFASDIFKDPAVFPEESLDFEESVAAAVPGDDEMRQYSMKVIADLLKEVDGPILVQEIATAQIAQRTMEVAEGLQPLRLSTLDLITNSADQRWLRGTLNKAQSDSVDSTEYQVFELGGADLGYAEGSQVYFVDQLDPFSLK